MIMLLSLLISLMGLLLPDQNTAPVVIPVGGNAWIKGSGEITESGLTHWTDPKAVCTVYFRFNQPGKFRLSVRLDPEGHDHQLKVTVAGKVSHVRVNGSGEQDFYVDEFTVDKPGYRSVEVQGVGKLGDHFGRLSAIVLTGSATAEMNYVRNNEGNFFYWGRRGPSVHIRYPFADTLKAEYFYNEITVPEGNDVIGSYFMTNGFGEGYFGLQVNSPTERRLLFSVWSPFQTDDPTKIPEDQKIVLLGKGERTHVGEFGNEGSGGQSYLKYFWKAGTTYRCLLRARPVDATHTVYTAWFFAPEENRWILIASWKRPKLTTYLTHLHSFLENFEPETGYIPRMARYGNQWIRTVGGQWMPLHEAIFTGDNTAVKGYRKDYGGGVMDNSFYLKNCGFFDDYTELRKHFEVKLPLKEPAIDFRALPGGKD